MAAGHGATGTGTLINGEPARHGDVDVQAFNPSPGEAETGGSLGVSGQPSLQNEFQDSQGYVERLISKNKQPEGNMQISNLTWLDLEKKKLCVIGMVDPRVASLCNLG